MRFGIKMRGLLIKVSVFLPLTIAAVVSIKFVSPILAPVIILTLLILIVYLNRVINRKLSSMWGPQLLSTGDYAIYEKGIYVKPVDIFYPWNELSTVRNDQSMVTFVFNDGTEISLPRDVINGLRDCHCLQGFDLNVGSK